MKISALIAVYNGEKTIGSTLESVLNQSIAPSEILVLDDGSTDKTASIVKSAGPRVTLFSVPNGGVAKARNFLSERAKGDLLAFLDADDLWYPEYLSTVRQMFEEHPEAVASYTGHTDFQGYGAYELPAGQRPGTAGTELISPVDFLVRYNKSTAAFGSMSYCCVRRDVLTKLGETPFCFGGVEDSYLACELALAGPVLYSPTPLVAYRITPTSLSASYLKTYGRWVQVFEAMRPRFEVSGNPALLRAFGRASASKRRVYSKILMGTNRVSEARKQLRSSLNDSGDPASMAKSFAMLSITYLPARLHPRWLSGARQPAASQSCQP